MEMSVGTIVTIVLLVTLLILGVVLIKNIFTGAKNVVDMTNDQLTTEIGKLFSTDSEMVIYPNSRLVEIKQTETGGVGVGIQNLLTGTTGNTKFSYLVSASDIGNCGSISKADAEKWITVGKGEDDISIPSGGKIARKVRFDIPLGAPLCTARFKIEVTKEGGTSYASDYFDIKVNAK
jgi:hypothetical protein